MHTMWLHIIRRRKKSFMQEVRQILSRTCPEGKIRVLRISMTVGEALERIYDSIHRDNEGLDEHIAALKEALAATGSNTVTVDPARLVQNNRQGRRLMQTYFRKRGVEVAFKQEAA